MNLSSKEGTGLILIFILLTTMTTLVLAFMSINSILLKSSGNSTIQLKSFWLAEAGFQQASFKINNEAQYRLNPTTITGILGEGSYSVAATKNGNIYSLSSTGSTPSFQKPLQMSVTYLSGYPEAFNYGIRSGGKINLNKSTTTITGDIASNKKILNQKKATVLGTAKEKASIKDITASLSSYKSIADQKITGNMTFKSGQTYNKIWYIEGDVQIQGGTTITGTIIASGSITINKNANNVTIAPSANYPALIAKSTIQTTGMTNSKINGLVFTEDQIKFKNIKDSQISGSLIANKDISISGKNISVSYDSKLKTSPSPYFSGDVSGHSVISQKNWKELDR